MHLATGSKKFLERARAQFKRAVEEERDIRREAAIDLAYVAGEQQWDEKIKKAREDSDRPALTFSKLHVYIQSVANEARQNKPQPKVNPIGGGATTDTANVINGILRHIQHRSHADVAMDTALDYSAGGSFGFVRLTTEFVPKSFDQEVRILTVQDPFSVYGVLMPACRGTECTNAFVVSTITREEYKEEHGGSDDDTPVDFESTEWRDAGDWIDAKNVRIAEYWWCEEEKRTLRQLPGNPTQVDGSPIPIYTDDKGYSEDLPFLRDEDGEIFEREEETCIVKSCKMDGTRVLPDTETEWTGDSIPIVAVLGRQMVIDGEIKLFSLVRHVREPQQLINIYKTAIAEKIGLGNRIPYLGYKGSFKDSKWQNANTVNYAYLEAEPVMINGVLAPLPQRQELEEQIQALSLAAAQEIEDLKSGMGIFDASLGSKGNETSGRGIERRQQQANVTNFHFSDNLNRAEWDLCVKLLKVIPKIYDRPGRQVRIVGEDQQHSVVVVNRKYTAGPDGSPLAPGEQGGSEKHYPLDVGEYDVVVTTGPSYTTARQEGADTLMDFFKVAPASEAILGDLWVGSLDYPWAREGARRLKAAAPQNIVNDQKDQGAPAIPPEVQQQMAAMQQKLQTTEQFAQGLHEQLETKQVEQQGKMEIQKQADSVKLEITRVQEETKRVIGLAQIDQRDAITKLQEELAITHRRVDQLHEMNMKAADQAHQVGMAAQAADTARASQESDQAHQVQQQTSSQDAAAAQAKAAQDSMPEAA